MFRKTIKDRYALRNQYRCRLDWGIAGVERAVRRGDIIVIVDILSFTTTTTYAVSKGVRIYPCYLHEEHEDAIDPRGIICAVHRNEVPELGKFSLSPKTFDQAKGDEKILLPSLNGAACSKYCENVPYVFTGSFLNAGAVVAKISRIISDKNIRVTVIVCGERETIPPAVGDLRPALEDYLGAGAILCGLKGSKSPEAKICETAFLSQKLWVKELIWDSVSGRELRIAGFGDDVVFACQFDVFDVVPIMKNGYFTAYDPLLD